MNRAAMVAATLLAVLASRPGLAADPPVDSPFDKADPEVQQLKKLNWKEGNFETQNLRTQCITTYALAEILTVLGQKADARADLLTDYLEHQKLGEAFGEQLSDIPEPTQISFGDAQKIALAFFQSPMGTVRFGDEFKDCDDTVLKGYLVMYAKKSNRIFAEVIESRHLVRAMGLFLEKEGKLKEFNTWADAERERRQKEFAEQQKQKREAAAAAEAARRADAEAALAERRRQEQERAAQQMALAMQYEQQGGQGQRQVVEIDDDWDGNTWWPHSGAYYASEAYRYAARQRISNRIDNWRPRPTPRAGGRGGGRGGGRR